MLRRSVMLRIDRDGVWFHEEAPFEHPHVTRTFNEGLGLHPDSGEAIVTIGGRFCYVRCDGTPFLVQRILLDEQRTQIVLNTGETLDLPSDGFFECEDRVAVKLDGPRWARLTRGVYDRLSPYLVLEAGRFTYRLPGGTHPVATG